MKKNKNLPNHFPFVWPTKLRPTYRITSGILAIVVSIPSLYIVAVRLSTNALGWWVHWLHPMIGVFLGIVFSWAAYTGKGVNWKEE